uniref:Uncharacterized protein LOC104227971 n=1 Tax=Nicotiana sylvestris TaxID=4096 RepID=A0A1U7WJ27_NICSY
RNRNRLSTRHQVNTKINIPIWWHTRQVDKKHIGKIPQNCNRINAGSLSSGTVGACTGAVATSTTGT